jgi:hypothetical protein
MRDPRLFHWREAGELKMDNPEKRTTKVQEDEEKHLCHYSSKQFDNISVVPLLLKTESLSGE